MTEFESINGIMREVVEQASSAWKERTGKGISYIFGDWPYIADTLTEWGKSAETAPLKFPCIALYSPFTERRGGSNNVGQMNADLSLIVLTNTRPEYANETREELSFAAVLRPIYYLFMGYLEKDKRVVKPYKGVLEHEYKENYRYGRSGVKGSDGKRFFDFIDAIEINRLKVTFKPLCAI